MVLRRGYPNQRHIISSHHHLKCATTTPLVISTDAAITYHDVPSQSHDAMTQLVALGPSIHHGNVVYTVRTPALIIYGPATARLPPLALVIVHHAGTYWCDKEAVPNWQSPSVDLLVWEQEAGCVGNTLLIMGTGLFVRETRLFVRESRLVASRPAESCGSLAYSMDW